jgi:transposase
MGVRRVGIDLANNGTHTAVVAEGGRVLGKPFRFDTTVEGMTELLRRAEGDGADQAEFVMEPTGNIWTVISGWLRAKGRKVRIVKTQKSSDLRKFFERHCKTDAVDAATIARVPEVDAQGAFFFQAPSQALFHLRRLIKERYRFVKNATAHKLRLHSLMQLANPHLLPVVGEDKFGPLARLLMDKMLNPLQVVARGRKALAQRLRRSGHLRVSADRLEAVWGAYQTTADLYGPLADEQALPFDYDLLDLEVRTELEGLAFAEKQMLRLDSRIARLYEQVDPTQTLRQIPGLGPVLASTIEAFSSPVERFANVRSFAAYCGVVPRRHQTGKGSHDKPGAPMTKAGPRLLKRALRLAADVARQHDPEFAAAYARRECLEWHHERILGLLAHKLARRIFAVLRRRELTQRTGTYPEPYRLRTPDGLEVSLSDGRRHVVEHYPSKKRRAEAARDAGRGAAAESRTDSGPPSRDDATRRSSRQPDSAADSDPHTRAT